MDTGQLTTSAAKPVPTSEFATFAPTAAPAQVTAPLEETKKPVVASGTKSGGAPRDPSAMQMESNAATAQHDSLTKLNDQRVKTETELGAAAQAKAQADLKYNEEYAAGLQQQEAKRAQDEARRVDELKRGEQDFAEFSKNPPKEVLDPERYWKSKGTGGQALGMIGILLSGIATGLQGPGAQNVALGILDKKIDADINSQKYNIDNNKDTWKTQLANKKTLLGMSRDRFGDERQGELAAKSAMIGLYEQKIRTEAARFGTAEAQANAENVLAALGEKRVAINDEFAKRQILVQQKKEAQAAAAAAASRAAAERAAERKAGIVTVGGKKFERTPEGNWVPFGEVGGAELAATKTTAGSTEGRNLLGSFKSLEAMDKQLESFKKMPGKPWTPEGQNVLGRAARFAQDTVAGANSYKNNLSTEDKARSDAFNTMRQALISMGTQLTGAGAPSEGEALRSAAGSAQSEEELQNVINTYRPVIGEKLTAYGMKTGK